MGAGPASERHQVLRSVHVGFAGQQGVRDPGIPASREGCRKNRGGAPLDSPEQERGGLAKADEVVPPVLGGAEHRPGGVRQFTEGGADDTPGQRGAIGADDHHSARPAGERRQRGPLHSLPEIRPGLRAKVKGGERFRVEAGFAFRGGKEDVTADPPESSGFFRGVFQEAGVKPGRFPCRQGGAKPGLYRSGNGGFPEEDQGVEAFHFVVSPRFARLFCFHCTGLRVMGPNP